MVFPWALRRYDRWCMCMYYEGWPKVRFLMLQNITVSHYNVKFSSLIPVNYCYPTVPWSQSHFGTSLRNPPRYKSNSHSQSFTKSYFHFIIVKCALMGRNIYVLENYVENVILQRYKWVTFHAVMSYLFPQIMVKAFVIHKKEPSSCFSCKTDTLEVVLFLQNRGNKLF